jgi:hypothetical protein
MLKARKRGEKEGCFDILGEKVAREIYGGKWVKVGLRLGY